MENLKCQSSRIFRTAGMAELKSGVTVVLGGQWGDEGKGKLVDILAQEADVVARCQVGKEGVGRL